MRTAAATWPKNQNSTETATEWLHNSRCDRIDTDPVWLAGVGGGRVQNVLARHAKLASGKLTAAQHKLESGGVSTKRYADRYNPQQWQPSDQRTEVATGPLHMSPSKQTQTKRAQCALDLPPSFSARVAASGLEAWSATVAYLPPSRLPELRPHLVAVLSLPPPFSALPLEPPFSTLPSEVPFCLPLLPPFPPGSRPSLASHR